MAITSVIRYIRALDTSVATGAGKTGLAFGDITAKYVIPGGTLTTLTTETIATLGTYQAPTSSAHVRIKELSSSDPAKGVYEVHFHDATLATGTNLVLMLSATGAAFVPLELDLANITGRIPTALSGGNMKSDIDTIKTQSVTAADGITFGVYVGGTAAASIASTALSTATWTGSLATDLATLAGHDPGSTIGTSTLTQTQVTGGAYSVQSSSCVLGDARVAHLNADIDSRMATYTQPTGFLAATFPATVASTTNITAGTIETVSGNVNGSLGGNVQGSVFGDIGGKILGQGSSVFTSVGVQADIQTIKTNAVINGGTVTFPTNSTLASTTNITAGTIETTTNLTNAPTSGDFTSTMKTSLNSSTPAVTVSDKTGFSLANSSFVTATFGTCDFTSTQKASITTAATAATPTVTAGTVSDKTGYSLAANQHVIVDSGTVTTLTNLPAITIDWLTGTGVAASAVTKIQNGLSTYAGGDTSGTTTLLTRVTGSVLLASDYTEPPTTAEIIDAMTGDSITPAKANEMLAAFLAGKISASSSGGITTYTYKRRDGSTTSFTSICSEENGTRASSGTIP